MTFGSVGLKCTILHILIMCVSSSVSLYENMLSDAWKMTGLLLHKCWSQVAAFSNDSAIPILQHCLKRRSLMALEKVLTSDVIKLASGVQLSKQKSENVSQTGSVGIQHLHARSHQPIFDWQGQVLEKIGSLLESHVLRVEFVNGIAGEAEEARRKHGDMMSLVLFGTVAVGLIVIPMGFQFLAVLGGKALLLAILALILTSIQGLKKIATSGINYGLYHLPDHNTWKHDKMWNYNAETPDGSHNQVYNNLETNSAGDRDE